jgi:methyl-accepting chemotaxis protein
MRLNNFKIAARLSIGFGLQLVLLLVLAGIALHSIRYLVEVIDTFADDQVQKLSKVGDWQISLLQTSRQTRNVIIVETPELVGKELDALMQRRTDRRAFQEWLGKTITSEAGKASLKTALAADAIYLPTEDELIKVARSGDMVRAKRVLLDSTRPRQLEYLDTVTKLLESQKALVVNSRAAADESYVEVRNTVIGFCLAALVIGLAAAYFITQSLVGPIRRASASARLIADGNLTETMQPPAGRDETTELLGALGAMQTNLVNIVSNVRRGSDAIASASSQISSGNSDLSGRTEQQASALQETAASMEELSSTVKQNADNARQANQLALTASTVAAKGGEVVAEVVGTMQGINDSSRKIADIISVIDGIAFQTNILALNAAVEAARAGEQGRGFAVVASEVRSLAQRSADAAKEIKNLISDSVGRVERGSHLVDQAGTTMSEVVTSIRRVTDIMGEISAASTEQSQGVEQVGEAVVQMDHTTQQNAALVEEMAAAASSMNSQAEELVNVVSVFKLPATQLGEMSPGGAAPAPSFKSAPVRQGTRLKLAGA